DGACDAVLLARPNVGLRAEPAAAAVDAGRRMRRPYEGGLSIRRGEACLALFRQAQSLMQGDACVALRRGLSIRRGEACLALFRQAQSLMQGDACVAPTKGG